MNHHLYQEKRPHITGFDFRTLFPHQLASALKRKYFILIKAFLKGQVIWRMLSKSTRSLRLENSMALVRPRRQTSIYVRERSLRCGGSDTLQLTI